MLISMLRSSCHFNPRPPRGGRRRGNWEQDQPEGISIHAPREGGDEVVRHRLRIIGVISIHAPREGGDSHEDALRWGVRISIHAPREGGD